MLINIYCDESCHLPNDNQPFMGLAYIKCPSNEVHIHHDAIREIIKKHGLFGELKWTNIAPANIRMYSEVVDYFFRQTNLSFRIIIIDKKTINPLTDFDTFYYKMMYQLVYHKLDTSDQHRVFVDIKDTLGSSRVRKLQSILNTNMEVVSDVQQIRSHEVILMQLTDVLLGSVTRANSRTTEGKAKQNIIKLIEGRYGRSVEQTSYKSEHKFNIFRIQLKNEYN